MEDRDTQVVMQSFGRCTITDDCLITFYEHLAGSSEGIATLFAQTDMPQQRRLLKNGLIHLIGYASGNEFSRQCVKELGESHSRANLNIRPELYDVWVDSLIHAIRRHDSRCTPELEAAWRRIVRPGIEAMITLYEK